MSSETTTLWGYTGPKPAVRRRHADHTTTMATPTRYQQLVDAGSEDFPSFLDWSATCASASLLPAGPWGKDQRLFLDISGTTVPEALTASAHDPSGKLMQQLVAISGDSDFCGIWRVVVATETRIECAVPPYDGAWKPSSWEARVIQLSGASTVSVSPKEQRGSHIVVALAPPLLFHTRATINALDNINVVSQSFQADIYTEMRLRAISSQPDEELIGQMLEAYGVREDMIELMGVIEQLSHERWTTVTKSAHAASSFDFCFRVRSRCIFSEEYELLTFPCTRAGAVTQDQRTGSPAPCSLLISLTGPWFEPHILEDDAQPLHVRLTCNIPTLRVRLTPNLEFPSLMLHRGFQQKSIFEIVPREHLYTLIEVSDPSESAAGYRYPRCAFVTVLNRRAGYYLSNVVLPLAAITGLTALSIGAIEADGSRLGTGDRLSVSLTLMLTAVAYKFIVAASLPQVSYLTLLDAYVLVCFGLIFLVCIENVGFPALAYDRSSGEPVELVDEFKICIAYLVTFALVHVVFAIIVLRITLPRRRAWECERAEETQRRTRAKESMDAITSKFRLSLSSSNLLHTA